MNMFTKIAFLTLFPVGLLNCVTTDEYLNCNKERTDQHELHDTAYNAWKSTPEYKDYKKAEADLKKASDQNSWLPDLTLRELASGPRTLNAFRSACQSPNSQECTRFEEMEKAFQQRKKDAKENYEAKEVLSFQTNAYYAYIHTCHDIDIELEKWERYKGELQDNAFKICKNTPEYKKIKKSEQNRDEVANHYAYVLPNRTWRETLSRTRTLSDFHKACCDEWYHKATECCNQSRGTACERFREMKHVYNELLGKANDQVEKAEKDFWNTKEFTEYEARFKSKEGLKNLAEQYLAEKNLNK